MTKVLTNFDALADLYDLPRPETAQGMIDNLMVLVNRLVLIADTPDSEVDAGLLDKYMTTYNAIEAHAQELARPAPRLTWTDSDGVHHSMSHKAALELLERFWTEWPGGWSEVEAEQKMRKAPLKWCDACGEGVTSFCRGKSASCPLFPAAIPEGDWLWIKLMDWCKKRGVSPASYNDLFAIVGEARTLQTND